MKILFTTTESLFSKLIQRVTGEDVSHVAIEFPECGVVVHSDSRGTRISSSTHFHNTRKVVYSVESESLKFQSDYVQDILAEYEDSGYDYGAFMFLGISLILRKYFKIPLRKSNLWQTTGMFLCVGLGAKIIYGKENDMMTPKQLYYKLRG